MQSRKIRIGMIFFGVFTALIIVFSQLFYFQGASFCKKEINTEQAPEKDTSSSGEESYISLPQGSLPSASTQVELNQESVCILEINFKEKTEEYLSTSVATLTGKFFQTLFRAIISPNAP